MMPADSTLRGYRLLFGAMTLAFPALWFLSMDAADLLSRALFLVFLVGIALRSSAIHRDRVVQLCAVLAALMVLGYLWQRHSLPEALFAGSSARRYFSAFCFFVVIAYGTTACPRLSPFLLLASAAVGLATYLAWSAPGDHWMAAWQGRRVDFGFRNAQHAGIVFATALLAGILFLPRAFRSRPLKARILIAPVLVAFVVLMLWGSLVTQVRAVWLGLAISISVALSTGAAWFFLGHRTVRGHRKRLGAVAAGLIVLLASGLYFFEADQKVIKRFSAEEISIETVARAARLEDQPLTSMSVRIASWSASLEWISERPLLGWGGRSASKLIEESPHFDARFKERFGHLHNSYLESMVTVGGAVVLCMLAIVALVGWRSVTSWRQGSMPTDVFLFAWAFFAFWVTVNMFESYVMADSGFYINALMGGFVYSFHLRGQGWGKRPTAAS